MCDMTHRLSAVEENKVGKPGGGTRGALVCRMVREVITDKATLEQSRAGNVELNR